MEPESFELNNAGVVLIGTCGDPTILEFMDQHYSIYRTEADDGTAKNPFNYSFEEDGSIITLTVTNVDGDQGIYTSESLGLQVSVLSNVVFYPNPVKNSLSIVTTSTLEDINVSVFNINGKRVLSKEIEVFDNYSLELSALKTGVYFLQLESKNGSKKVEKFVKL